LNAGGGSEGGREVREWQWPVLQERGKTLSRPPTPLPHEATHTVHNTLSAHTPSRNHRTLLQRSVQQHGVRGARSTPPSTPSTKGQQLYTLMRRDVTWLEYHTHTHHSPHTLKYAHTDVSMHNGVLSGGDGRPQGMGQKRVRSMPWARRGHGNDRCLACLRGWLWGGAPELGLWLGKKSTSPFEFKNQSTAITGNVMKLSTKHISTKCALRIPLIHHTLSLGLNSGV
jgi:hypothetical protein